MDNELKIASKFIIEKEGGSEYKKGNEWEVYHDKIGNVATVGPGLTPAALPSEYKNMKAGQRISADVVNTSFQGALKSTNIALEKKFGKSYLNMNPNQKASTISLIHNVGMGGFKTGGKEGNITKAYKALMSGNYDVFRKEAFDKNKGFVRAGGKIIEGLQNRRRYEDELFTKPFADEDIAMNIMKKSDAPIF